MAPSNSPAPTHIPNCLLGKMTKADLKAELNRRGVSRFLSKLKKQELLSLLQDSLHLPVVAPEICAGAGKQSSIKWNKEHPAWQLLYNEIKEGNVPVDPNKMGPSAVFEKYSHTMEFQMEGMELDDTFIQRLHDLRLVILNEEPLLPWNEIHPARMLLCKELEDGKIPVDVKEMGPAEVHCTYANTLEFNLRGMEHSKTFDDRLQRLRTIVGDNKKRKADDELALRNALKHHPVPALNHHGYPQWNGSFAQALLKMDISAGEHKKKTPSKMWEESEIYMEGLPKEHMRWRIRCEVRTNKYLHTLKYKADMKLRENLKDLPKDVQAKLNL